MDGMDYIQYYESPLGRILLAGDGRALKGLWFTGQKYFASTLTAEYREGETDVKYRMSSTKQKDGWTFTSAAAYRILPRLWPWKQQNLEKPSGKSC